MYKGVVGWERKRKALELEELEETEEEARKKKSPPRRTSRDLVAKKKMSRGSTVGKGRKSRKGGVPSAAGTGKKVLPKKVPSRKDSNRKHVGGRGFMRTSARGFHHEPGYYTMDDQNGCLIDMAAESSGTMRNR